MLRWQSIREGDRCKPNKLSVNPAKSNAMVISPKHGISYNDIALKYDNKPILLTNEVKYLCVTLHSKLDFHAHIKLIENKISRSLGKICKLRNFFPHDIPLKLYYSLVHPLLLYGSFYYNTGKLLKCCNPPSQISFIFGYVIIMDER